MEGAPKLLGLSDLFRESPEIAEIADESPLVIAALHRLLLAVLHRTFGPRDTEEWGKLWRRGAFPEDDLQQYWAKWEHRFDLFDETFPFYQSATITEKDEPRTISVLEFHRASGNNATLVDHTVDERLPTLSPAEAARALITHQTFALGGTIGYLKSCEQDNDKRGSDAPAARGAHCLIRGGNLFETLVLNLAEYDPEEEPRDVPAWEKNPSQGKGERSPYGRVDLYTWQSRRARLFPRVGEGGTVTIDRAKLVPGHFVPVLWDPYKVEPLQSFIRKEDAKSDERPWSQFRIDDERAVWRNSSALLFGDQNPKPRSEKPENLRWLAKALEDEELSSDFLVRIDVLGMATTTQQKVKLWRREQIPIAAGLLQDDYCHELLASALMLSETTSFALRAAARRMASEILGPNLKGGGGKPDSGRVDQLAKSFGIEGEYWSRLEASFSRFLAVLSESQLRQSNTSRGAAMDVGFGEWKLAVRRAALGTFDSASTGIIRNGRGLRACALAEQGLRKDLFVHAQNLAGADATAAPADQVVT